MITTTVDLRRCPDGQKLNDAWSERLAEVSAVNEGQRTEAMQKPIFAAVEAYFLHKRKCAECRQFVPELKGV